MRRSALGSFVVAASLAPLAAQVALAQEAAPTVVDIEFRGNRRYAEDTLRLTLRTKKGQRLDRALLPEDVAALYAFFETVDLREESVPGGVKLVFLVSENPEVSQVDVVGTDQVSETEVRGVMETAPGRPLADFRVQNDRRKIERLYRSKGHHYVQVTPRVEDAAGGAKKVTFEVLEGPEVEIDEIVFAGNTAFRKEDLLEQAAMRERAWFGLRPGPYVEEMVRQDLLSIRNHYRLQGWLDAQVELEDVAPSADRRRVTLKIRVVEGPVYKVGNVTIDGVRSFPGGSEALLGLLPLRTGERKSQELLLKGIEAIERAYREEGFYAAVVTPEEKLRPNEPVVDVALHVDEASKVRVREIRIAGNTRTQDKVIRREIPLAPGDVLNRNNVEKGVTRLRGLGYFERVNARVEPPLEGEDPNLRDVTFEVDDTAPTGSARFGIQVSSDGGAAAQIGYTKRNFDWKDVGTFGEFLRNQAFVGGGQELDIELSPGTEDSRYRLSFVEPWLFDKPLSFGFDVFFAQNRRFDFDQDAVGIDFFLGRRWTFERKDDDYVFGIQGKTRVESHEISSVQEDSAPTAFLAEGSNSVISEELSLRLSRLDSVNSPTRGWYAELSSEVGFAGDVRLWRNTVESRRYWTLFRNDEEQPHVVSLGARLSVAEPLGSSTEADPNLFDEDFVPFYESYLAGGSSSGGAIRGFAYGGVGPHGEGDPFLARRRGETAAQRRRRLRNVIDSVLENDGESMAGRVLAVASAEYTFPLYENILRGVVFTDAGTVRHSFSSTHGLEEDDVRRWGRAGTRFDEGDSFFSDFRASAGVGIRFKIPFLGNMPLALDFAVPLREQDGDDTQIVSFSIRRDF